jgi:hypothetical protein
VTHGLPYRIFKAVLALFSYNNQQMVDKKLLANRELSN